MNQRKAGVILDYVAMTVRIVAGVLYVPLLLHFLTKEVYGVYKVMGSLIALVTIMDMGLNGTIVRYYTKSKAEKDMKAQQNILAICLIIYSIITAVLIVLGFILYFFISPIFGAELTTTTLPLAKKVFIIMFINLAISIPTKIFGAVINSHEKFIFHKTLGILSSILAPILILIAFTTTNTQSLILVVVIQTIVNLATILAKVIFCFSKLKIKIKLHEWNKKLVKEVSIFASLIFLAMIVDTIYWKIDYIVIGAFVSMSGAALFSVSGSIISYYKDFSGSVGSVFMPQITTIEATTKNNLAIDNIFRKVGRIQTYISGLLLSGIIIFGIEFISLWLSLSKDSFSSADIKLIYNVTLLVIIPLFIPQIQATGPSILEAKNKHKFRSLLYLAVAILNLTLSLILVKRYGIIGSAIGTALGLVISHNIIINFYYAKIGLNIGRFFKEVLLILLPITVYTICAYFLNALIITSSILALLTKILIYSLIYLVIIRFLCFNKYEKALDKEPMEKLKAKISKGKINNELYRNNEKPN